MSVSTLAELAPRPETYHQLDDAAARALDQLNRVAARQRWLPCRLLDPFGDAAERDALVEECATCPILEPCGNYADLAGEAHGVWAGRDRTRRTSRTRAGTARAPRGQHLVELAVVTTPTTPPRPTRGSEH